ncbi:MAG: acetate/propionate family kinase [Planctomycetota bacterium]
MTILVFNVGSTTLKYSLFDPSNGFARTDGLVDRIGQPGGDAADHVSAARRVMDEVGMETITAIGHRIVQGGDCFSEPTVVNEAVIKQLRRLDGLAPLHNPAARMVVEGLMGACVPQTLVFDTAFYTSLPPEAFRYAVPGAWFRDHGVRRYGFHGTSHQYVTQKALLAIGRASEPVRMVSLHLGGGASATATIDGVAVDTSMGMTPLEGLVMATRSGDLDPAIIFHMMRHADMSIEEIDGSLNKQSGLKGLCGDADMRVVLRREADGDADAKLAVEMFIRRITKVVGGFAAVLGGLDALIFTAGIGEHSPEIRARVCVRLAFLGTEINDEMNANFPGDLCDLSTAGSRIRTLVVRTDEELAIAEQVLRTLN